MYNFTAGTRRYIVRFAEHLVATQPPLARHTMPAARLTPKHSAFEARTAVVVPRHMSPWSQPAWPLGCSLHVSTRRPCRVKDMHYPKDHSAYQRPIASFGLQQAIGPPGRASPVRMRAPTGATGDSLAKWSASSFSSVDTPTSIDGRTEPLPEITFLTGTLSPPKGRRGKPTLFWPEHAGSLGESLVESTVGFDSRPTSPQLSFSPSRASTTRPQTPALPWSPPRPTDESVVALLRRPSFSNLVILDGGMNGAGRRPFGHIHKPDPRPHSAPVTVPASMRRTASSPSVAMR